MSAPPSHTPGPWMVPARMTRIISEGSWHTIAVCGPDGDPNWTLMGNETVEANARLIAAAPDLLEALTAILHTYDQGGVPLGRGFKMANAAIAKALGREAASPESAQLSAPDDPK